MAQQSKKKEEKKHRGVFEKEPGSKVWWVRYNAEGKIKREKVGRKSDAITLYQIRKSEIAAGVKLPSNLRHRGMTLGIVIDRANEWYKAHRPRSLRTAQGHLETIKKALGTRIAADLTPADIDKWLSAHDEWSDATRNRYKSTLGRALQLALIDGRLTRNAARLVVARKESSGKIRWLLEDEETRLTAAILKNWPEYIQSFRIALHTGLRAGEQFSLEWADIDFERKRIFVGRTKNDHNREVPMSRTCLAAFEELRTVRPHGVPWVFLSARYKKSPQRLLTPGQWFPDACEAAKVHNFTWHSLRHTFVSRLVMAGVPLPAVQQLAGHKSIVMTARYSHLAPAHLAGAVEKLDPAVTPDGNSSDHSK
jgi:integrase